MSKINGALDSTNINNKKVTIGVCVRNGAALLGNAIDSILSQNFPHDNMELIFVDDGSHDNTLSIIQNYLPKLDISVKVFHHDWKGLGISRDLVVDNAVGEYIIWVDCDMTISADFVTKQVEFMDKDSTLGIAKGQYGICSQKSLAGYLENIEFVAAHIRRIEKPNSLPLGTGGSIYRVRAIRQAGGFNHNIRGSGEDTDAENRVRKTGWKLAATAPVFYEKRRGSWGTLWTEYFWLGKSISNLSEGEKYSFSIYRLWPPVMLLVELFRIITAYRMTRRKIVFLMPIHFIFKRAAWFLGFVRVFLSGSSKIS